MIEKIDVEELERYKLFLSRYGAEVYGLTEVCLNKVKLLSENWQDGHVEEVISAVGELKSCMEKFSKQCEDYCLILQKMAEGYRQYLSGRFGN